ncbi:hypothetical protein NQ317_015909 [Molorchus minor]|uniref:XPG N-terminal domain-containing protein n=1 Tax=Molorchus minor TaxID=1323400 RepID=A0ABQ9J2F5_9CUCU|nr:hypothetical protein NQ317_015909 [Molorchus minor]
MGIRGLTTFIQNRAHLYMEKYELHDSKVVIDGNSIACQLYKYHCSSNDCFGGDYDKFAKVITNFFKILSECNVTPYVIFDGGYESRKMKTVMSRMKNKIKSAELLNSATEGSISVFPLFLRETFLDITLKLNIKCVRCDFEGDTEIANIARALKCPVISYDSDFFIFDVLYIPFPTVEINLRKKRGSKNYSYIGCEVYKVEKFLNSFGGMSKSNLPILAVLLGNDYGYSYGDSVYLKYLEVNICNSDISIINVESIAQEVDSEDIEENSEEDNDEDLSKYDSSSEDDFIVEHETAVICNKLNWQNVSEIFLDNFRKCLYPPCFMDILLDNKYYCIPQVENSSLEYSHAVSSEILIAIHKILTNSNVKLTCIGRHGCACIKRYVLSSCDNDMPLFEEIQNMEVDSRKLLFLRIIEIDDGFRGNLDDYINILLRDSISVRHSLKLITGKLREIIGNENMRSKPSKRRKKKKKHKEVIEMQPEERPIEDEFSFDPNNKFSVLFDV